VNNIIQNKTGMGKCYLRLEKFNLALDNLNEGLEIAQQIGVQESVKDIYFLLSEYYEIMGSFQKSLSYHKLHTELKDTIFNNEKQKQIFELQTKYETEKKEQEIATLNITNKLKTSTIKNQKNVIIFFIFGFVLVVTTSFLLLRLYRQIKKANVQLNRQNEIITNQKEDITSSIQYASIIQTAVLPSEEAVSLPWPELMVLFKPRDIVSGDFYWINHFEDKSVLVAADCTGHGVPGAFMSMLGTTFLNEIILTRNIIDPGEILTELRKSVKFSLKQTGKEDKAKDGMDLALSVLYKDDLKLEFAGAYNPLWLYRKNREKYELMETKADRNPIGIHHKEIDRFTTHKIDLEKGDTMFMFSDGYADQFGHSDQGKFKTKNLKKLLLEHQDKSLTDQKEFLEQEHKKWKGNEEQIDDILIIGFRV